MKWKVSIGRGLSKEAIGKRKESIVLDEVTFPQWEEQVGLIGWITPSCFGGDEDGHVTDSLIGVDQKIPG